MAILKLSATEKRRASVFFTCLVLSILAWIMVTLSKSYNYTVRQVVTFKNIPQKRAFHSLQSDTINVTLSGSGWQMLFSKMSDADRPVKIDLHTLETMSYVALDPQIPTINETRDTNNRIIGFNPDTLYFDFSHRSSKRVPVQLLLSLKYQRQFAQSDNIIIRPLNVTVSGPSNRIDKITSWKTDSLSLKDVNEGINTRVNLEPVGEGNINVYPKNVHVIVPVTEFTEKTIEVPVKLVNNYNYYNVKVFPQKVKVTFTTPLIKYADMSDDLFEAEADLDMWKLHGYSVLPVMLTKLPEFCKIVKIEPKNIDFIIRK